MVPRSALIRVGFPLLGGGAWMGGRVYLWNLLYAIAALGDQRRIAPVVLDTEADEAQELLTIDGVTLAPSPRWWRAPVLQIGARALKRAIGRDLRLEQLARRASVALVSHAAPLGRRSRQPWLAWIPDVQHRRLPEQFGALERRLRDDAFVEAARDARAILFSSQAARADFFRYYGDRAASRCHVLPFVTQPRGLVDDPEMRAALAARYQLPPRYFYLPNQFWRHKNHTLVIAALALLRDREPDVVVIATGAPHDHRHPEHYRELMARVERERLGRRLRHLGMVPFADVIGLMRGAVAVINPSRFEGWSTTVEEAKSLGKRVLLSDIDVHREQAPARGSYFPVDDAAALAALLRAAWHDDDAEAERAAAATAAATLAARTRAFAAGYQAIALAALAA